MIKATYRCEGSAGFISGNKIQTSKRFWKRERVCTKYQKEGAKGYRESRKCFRNDLVQSSDACELSCEVGKEHFLLCKIHCCFLLYMYLYGNTFVELFAVMQSFWKANSFWLYKLFTCKQGLFQWAEWSLFLDAKGTGIILFQELGGQCFPAFLYRNGDQVVVLWPPKI